MKGKNETIVKEAVIIGAAISAGVLGLRVLRLVGAAMVFTVGKIHSKAKDDGHPSQKDG